MTTRVVVFGREPVLGRVKTRLAATHGDDRAAAAYALLLDHAIGAAMASGFEVVLSLAEPPSRDWAQGLQVAYDVQHGANLGRRMANAFATQFRGGAERAVIVGTDCPALTSHHVCDAVAKLDDTRVVLGPASDGGYWLVAQRRPGVDLFSGIPWSSPATLSETRQRLGSLGVEWSELETLSDIDTGADLDEALDVPTVPAGLRERLRHIVTR